MWIIISVILLIALLYTLHLLSKKQELDKTKKAMYKEEIEQLREQRNDLKNDIEAQEEIIEENNDKIKNLHIQYKLLEKNQEEELTEQYKKRKKEFDENALLQSTAIQQELKKQQASAEERMNIIEQAVDSVVKEAEHRAEQANKNAEQAESRFNALLEPLKKYEADQQLKLYYTIQVPEEYKPDIDFLLNDVSQKIQHPDIINKLVWAEYVKPYIEETFKRANIKDDAGIYKITNINSGKCYIGKSTNIKKRLADHFKSSIGITSIADQAVHHEILREGYWNWMIEPIIYCDKDKLSELEKYYINFFKSQEFGYNKRDGG